MVIEFCEENPNGAYEDMLNKIEVSSDTMKVFMELPGLYVLR